MKGELRKSVEDLKQASDEELMVVYQEGHEEAFMLLYERHSAKVYGFLLSRLRDRPMSDDVFQATFLKLHRLRGKYDPSLPFAPWLFTICRTVMLDAIRAQKRVTTHETLDEVAMMSVAAPLPSEPARLPDFLPDLSRLPANQRQALELRHAEALSFEEIAVRLNTTPENTRQLVSRAIRRLKSWMPG